MERFQYGMYNVDANSKVARWMKLKKLNPSKQAIEIQTKPIDLEDEIQTMDHGDDELVKKIRSYSFSSKWLGKWLLKRVQDDNYPEEAKTLWSEFCFSYADKILAIEKENIHERSIRRDYRIFVMKQIESMFFASRALLTTLPLRSKPSVSDPEATFQTVFENVIQYVDQTKLEERNIDLFRDPTYEAMDEYVPTNPFETKKKPEWTSGNPRPAQFPQDNIQNAESTPEERLAEVPLSRVSKKKFLKRDQGDPFSLIRQEFT